MNTTTNRNEAIMSAWNQITAYVKENYANIFATDLTFRWCHNVYGWTEFGVTPNGTAFIKTGSHGCTTLTKWYGHPLHTDYNNYSDEPMKPHIAETVINDWNIIKAKLEAYASKEKALYAFHV